ncbi:MAG: NUDIX domain-containing protein [Planctomycetota bacterium]
MTYTYDYPRPALTVDCVVFGYDEGALHVLLIERGAPPFEGAHALPGGFVDMEEDLEAAARRELAEETGVTRLYLEQLGAFGAPGRDPRGRVVTIAYVALVKLSDHAVRAATDARAAAWHPVEALPALAFDHTAIIACARTRLAEAVRSRPIGFELLPKKFTLTDLQRLVEAALGRPLDKRNFRKKVLSLDLLVPLDEVERNVPRRAAQLFRFDRRRYARLEQDGFQFRL